MADSQLLCCTCKEPAGDNPSQVGGNGNSVRCNGCTKSRGRLQRLLASDGKLREGWGILDDATKAECVAKGHDFMGMDIKKMLETTIVETVCKSTKREFEAHGEYKDREFLEKKYKGKPETLRLHFELAPTYECPIKGKLWQDVEYRGSLKEGTQEFEERTVV